MPKTSAAVTQADYIKAYRIMLLSRVLEEKLASLYRAGMIKGGVFLGRGQEALSVSVGIHLHRGDIFAPSSEIRPAAWHSVTPFSIRSAPISDLNSAPCGAGMEISTVGVPVTAITP